MMRQSGLRRLSWSAVAMLCIAGSFGCEGEISSNSISANGQVGVNNPSTDPTTQDPTKDPIKDPTKDPTDPTKDPTKDPMVNPNSPVKPAFSHLRRLTAKQYQNTVRHALGEHFATQDLPVFNDDIPTIGLSNSPDSLRISDVNVDSFLSSTEKISVQSVASHPELKACAEAQGDGCFEGLINDFGLKLWRRPVTAEERGSLMALRDKIAQSTGTREQQLEFVIQALIASPNTLYRSELGEPEGEFVKLTSYELASVLSYSFWDSPPDEVLLGLAKQGELHKRDVLLEQAKRMGEDERLAEAMAAFVIDYLKLDALPSKDKDASLGLTNKVRQALLEGVRRDLVEVFSQPGATLLDPFLLKSFYVNKDTAEFFGVTVSGDQYEKVAMDEAERQGLLSHPVFLAVHSNKLDTGIVKRGVFTLEQLLCVKLGDPPADISGKDSLPKDFDPSKHSTRELLYITHSSQEACVGCHTSIDPAGFGYEQWDAAGRFRTTEKGGITIDASSFNEHTGTDGLSVGANDTLLYTDSASYVQALATSPTLHRCVSNTFVRYILGDAPSNSEKVEIFKQFDASKGEVKPVLESIITTPSFTLRQLKKGGQQ